MGLMSLAWLLPGCIYAAFRYFRWKWDHRMTRTRIAVGVVIYVVVLVLVWHHVPPAPAPAVRHFQGWEHIWSTQSKYMPRFNMDTRKFEFPWWSSCGGGNVWIDVGGNHQAGVPAGASFNPFGTPVLAFEPLKGYWTQLKEQGSCVYAFPMAASTRNGWSTFQLSRNGHSSSMLKTKKDLSDVAKFGWNREIAETEEVTVMTVRLDEIIPRLPHARVQFLKVDAQGYDLEVVKSAGEWIRVVDRLEIECTATERGFYQGAPTKADITAYMKTKGFEYEREEQACCLDEIVELNVWYVNTDRSLTIPEIMGTDLPQIMGTGKARVSYTPATEKTVKPKLTDSTKGAETSEN